mgnify:CR=1 FL=1
MKGSPEFTQFFSPHLTAGGPKDLGLRSTTELPRHSKNLVNPNIVYQKNKNYILINHYPQKLCYINEPCDTIERIRIEEILIVINFMRKDRYKAEILRRQGKSYKEIRKKLGIPLGTLSDWFKFLEWSKKIRDKLAVESSLSSPHKLAKLVKANKERWDLWHKASQQEAIKEFPSFSNNILFATGIMLYWGEGDKKLENSMVRLANSDPGLIKIYYLFLTRCLKISESKISIRLLLYPDLIEDMQKIFWSKASGLPLSIFKKSTYIVGRHPTKRLSYGVCNVYVHSRQLKEKIMKWIELYQSYLSSDLFSY